MTTATHDYPACAVFRGGRCTCDSADEPAAAPRFAATYCSQCGADLGPGDAGVSSCCDHGACQVKARGETCECSRAAPTMAQRLDALMRRCREECHEPTYADLVAVRGAA